MRDRGVHSSVPTDIQVVAGQEQLELLDEGGLVLELRWPPAAAMAACRARRGSPPERLVARHRTVTHGLIG